jgi:SAM-dependent methyltransferase
MTEEEQIETRPTEEKNRALVTPNLHDKVLGLVNQYLKKDSEILDLGCGEGDFSRRLLADDYRAIAVDGYDHHWRNPQIPLHIANFDTEFARKISPEGKDYDAIAAIEIIEHVENPFAFLRECYKLLKPNGLLFLTSPNVESITSRIVFLYTGRLKHFGEPETLRLAHITPIFKWKIDLAFQEIGFEYVWEGYNQNSYHVGDRPHNKIGSVAAKLLRPFVKGEKNGENRIVVARRAAE